MRPQDIYIPGSPLFIATTFERSYRNYSWLVAAIIHCYVDKGLWHCACVLCDKVIKDDLTLAAAAAVGSSRLGLAD